MQQMVRDLLEDPRDKNIKVTEEQYRQWARGFIFEGLRNQRYGQSFCNHFAIRDNILYYSGSVADADRYIREMYVK
jgi:predicted double-glycine peptidase